MALKPPTRRKRMDRLLESVRAVVERRSLSAIAFRDELVSGYLLPEDSVTPATVYNWLKGRVGRGPHGEQTLALISWVNDNQT